MSTREMIELHFNNVKVNGNIVRPRKSAFEITDENGTLIFSKLESGLIPSDEDVLELLLAAGFD